MSGDAADPASLSRPEVILFDWDNTLIDNWGTIHEALNAALTAMGQEPWTFEQALAGVRESLRDSFPKRFGDRWEEAKDIFYATYGARHLETLEVIEGAGETLAALAATGVTLGVISNKTGHLLRAEAERLDWTRHFACLVGAGDAPADKPDPAVMDFALAATGHSAGPHVWYVGDAAIDIALAHRTGCTGILSLAGRVHKDEAIDPPAHAVVNTLGSLQALAAG